MTEPFLLEGGLAVDDRGEMRHVNAFGFAGVKRFYLVANHQSGFVRAWHGHRREAKYVLCVRGAAVVGAVQIDNWSQPDKSLQPKRFVLSAQRPAVLYIPAGYANGFMTLTPAAELMFFSTATLEESRDDDVRFEARYWDIWHVQER